jgi:hypothetical protein
MGWRGSYLLFLSLDVRLGDSSPSLQRLSDFTTKCNFFLKPLFFATQEISTLSNQYSLSIDQRTFR